MTSKKNIIAEYVWLGGKGELRSKSRTIVLILNETLQFKHLKNWNYDGSSTNQANGSNSEVILKPQTMYNCPFRGSPHVLVMCDTYDANMIPISNNYRFNANEMFNKNLEEKPWFGIEQEFFMIDNNTNKPLGFPKDGNPNPQGQYYCSVGSRNTFGREIIDKHYMACLNAGIQVSGINAEVAPGQWEFQVGPVEGINAGDQLWIARYILERITEEYNISIDYEPKPLKGDWNGFGS